MPLLFDHLASIAFRIIGYAMFAVAGAGIATHDSPLGIIGAVVLGHLFVKLSLRVEAHRNGKLAHLGS